MASLHVTDEAVPFIERANMPNVINTICSSDDDGLVIDDNRDDPAWAAWWARYAGPELVPVVVPPDPMTTLLAALADAQSLEEVRQAAEAAGGV